MLNMTGIEEIVKYQQELLNHQRSQKLIQKETLKLLSSLNKNITFMSDRLDEFALKTNIKLETLSACEPAGNAGGLALTSGNLSQANNNNPINVNTLHELNNTVNSSDTYFNNSMNSNFYDTQLDSQPVSNLVAGSSGLPNGLSNGLTSGLASANTAMNLGEDIKEYYILSDCNLEPLTITQNPLANGQNGQLVQQTHPQQLVLMQQHSPSTNAMASKNIKNSTSTNNSSNSNNAAKIKSSPNKLNNSRNRSAKLLDTTNINSANTTNTSDESIDDDLSLDESSEDEKETIQIRKKPKTTYPSNQPNPSKSKEYEEGHNQQRLFNKYVRESVENRLGKEFLLLHEIQEIDHEVMESIKKDALESYPPINIRPRRAWHLAKASLRCRRRSLRRQKEKQILSTSSADNTLNILDPNANVASEESSPVQTMITMTNL